MKYVVYWIEDDRGIEINPPQKSDCYMNTDLNALYKDIQYNLYKSVIKEINDPKQDH